jgi:integrase
VLKLSWDDPSTLMVDLSGEYAKVNIPAGGQKNGKAEIYAVAPEFEEMLLSVHENERHGLVFRPLSNRRRCPNRLSEKRVSKGIADLSEAAGVKVLDEEGSIKWATAHDFRRSFGSRWAKRVMPAVLMRLMRHGDMKTTMKYYATKDSDSVAEAARKAIRSESSDFSSDSLGNQSENHAKTAASSTSSMYS